MPDFKNYSPDRITVSFGAILIQGFNDGTMIKTTRNEDAYSVKVGGQGDVTRVRSLNKTGQITVTLLAESPTNDLLSAQAIADELSGAAYAPIFVKDLNGTTLMAAENAWIMKMPETEHATDASPREWVFECADLTMVVGGSLV